MCNAYLRVNWCKHYCSSNISHILPPVLCNYNKGCTWWQYRACVVRAIVYAQIYCRATIPIFPIIYLLVSFMHSFVYDLRPECVCCCCLQTYHMQIVGLIEV